MISAHRRVYGDDRSDSDSSSSPSSSSSSPSEPQHNLKGDVRLHSQTLESLRSLASSLSVSHAGNKPDVLARLRRRLGRVNHKHPAPRGVKLVASFPTSKSLSQSSVQKRLARRGQIVPHDRTKKQAFEALLDSLDKGVYDMTLHELHDEIAGSRCSVLRSLRNSKWYKSLQKAEAKSSARPHTEKTYAER